MSAPKCMYNHCVFIIRPSYYGGQSINVLYTTLFIYTWTNTSYFVPTCSIYSLLKYI